MNNKMPGNLLTTAMAVMPHTDVKCALETALSMDVPFWPQLPNFSYTEDMYVQGRRTFPGNCAGHGEANAKLFHE